MADEKMWRLRVNRETQEIVDRWRGKQMPVPTISEAVRELVKRGAKVKV